MNLLMISGERGIPTGKKSPFWHTLEILREKFERIDVLCPRTSVLSPVLSPFSNVFFHPSPWSLFSQSRWIREKGSELNDIYHYDVMTVHSYPPFYNDLGGLRLSNATRIPFILEFHDGEPTAMTPRLLLEHILLRWWIPFIAKRAIAVRVVNENARRMFLGWGVEAAKIHKVPSFYIDTSLWFPDHAVSKKQDLVFCGRLAFTKGLPDLLRALVQIPDVTLVVIGDGPLRAHCESLVSRLGLQKRVQFLGWVQELHDVANVFRSSRIFVLPSKIEGGPRVALEAMACGIPVIATKVGIMPDVIQDGENGLLVSPGAGGLLSAIRRMLEHPSLQEKIASQAPAIVRRFERRTCILAYANFLQRFGSRD